MRPDTPEAGNGDLGSMAMNVLEEDFGKASVTIQSNANQNLKRAKYMKNNKYQSESVIR
jgi:hypothetical protein